MMSSKYERKQRRREQERQRQEHQRANQAQAPDPPSPSPPGQPVENPKETEKAQGITEPANNNDRGGKPSRPWWSWLTSRRTLIVADIVFAGTIAAATIAQVYYGNKQWEATEKQWQSMEKQLDLTRLDQRPWFRVELTPTKELKGGEPFHFEVAVTNAGKSIGTYRGQVTLTVPLMQEEELPGNGRFENVNGTIMIELDENLLKQAEASMILGKTSHVAVPGQTIRFEPGGQHPLIPEVIPLINSEKVIVVVVVIIEYSDIQGTRHRTRACFVYDPHKRICFEYSRYHYMN